MNKISVILLSILLSSGSVLSGTSDNWALLISGSGGYGNYGMNADVCHLYHVLLKGGIPASQIVVFAPATDVANDPSNPIPGKLFNKPDASGANGVDVFSGCVIDYKSPDMTLNNLWAAMKGDSSAIVGGSGKVLNTNENSSIFISYDDHGGKGVVAYPGGTIYANDLINTLTWMHDNKRFKNLLFYMEACFSGSMFQGMSSDLAIYAVTSANANEYGWMTYCPPEDLINGVHLNTCLGDQMNTAY